MEGTECLLEAIFQESAFGGAGDDGGIEEDGKEDVEMVDAETLEPGGGGGSADGLAGGDAPQTEGGSGIQSRGRIGSRDRGKKKNRRKRKRGGGVGGGGATASIADMNRFVIEICRHLKEHKSYLLWNAIGCLGVSVVKDLVKEVDAIQRCGGQKIADGRRFRTGGGILWNILKTREPKAYKEIMSKGREFEKQFKESKAKMRCSNEAQVSNISIPNEAEVSDNSEHGADVEKKLESSEPKTQHKKLMDRMRVPVSYDDLLEEGEIC
ncbi:calcium-dependent protein kinase [Musa troglodytarum]|uniref:Phosphorylated adapter RNA export protein n=1 Tax=Musa troglodytarum TaxID=320322 RepID=A0A9E7I3E8_9LILI|nr:calcium-dependent protein kinase [Musa troglodytarum]